MRRAEKWTEAGQDTIGSLRWRQQVAAKLIDGYGVEDIALWLDCHLSHVRAEVARLRAEGVLQKWWGRG